ncbi:hypothetical protein [Streptomyces sp. DT18]
MRNAEIRRLDREIERATKKLEAVRRGEWWPLNGKERRAMTRAAVSGAYQAARGRSPQRADARLDSTGSAAEIRLNAELNALHSERQRLITEAAREKAKKKASGWF